MCIRDSHFNDVIETTVMSMFYGSLLQAMPPKLHSTNFPGMVLIRPLYCVREEDIIAWKRYNDLSLIHIYEVCYTGLKAIRKRQEQQVSDTITPDVMQEALEAVSYTHLGPSCS